MWQLVLFSCRCSTGLPRLLLWQDNEELLFWSSPLPFCLLQASEFHILFFQQAHNFPWGLEHCSRFRLQAHPGLPSFPYAAHLVNAAAPSLCQLGNGVCSVWKIVNRICTSTYSLFTLQILLLLSTVSSLWLFLGEIVQNSLRNVFLLSL